MIQQASKDIAESIDLINHRQKLTRLADESDLGWGIVKEYEANPLASDSEDEKKMYWAEARATKKLKDEKRAQTKIKGKLNEFHEADKRQTFEKKPENMDNNQNSDNID